MVSAICRYSERVLINITTAFKDENKLEGILRVMYGIREGSHFLGTGFGV